MDPTARALTTMTAGAGAAEPDCGCDEADGQALIAAPVAVQPSTEPDAAFWEGCIGIEGEMTGDGRFIEPNALTWTLPMPIRYVRQDVGAHDGAEVAGRILTLERRQGGVLWASGDFDMGGECGREAFRQVQNQLTTGISMDLDDVTFEVRVAQELVEQADQVAQGATPEGIIPARVVNADGTVTVATVKADEEVRATTQGRVRAATIVAIPAFAKAQIAISASAPVPLAASARQLAKTMWIPVDEEEDEPAPTGQPDPEDAELEGDPEVGPDAADITDEDVTEQSLAGKPGGAAKLIKWYLTGEGAARIRWGTDGDFPRCVQIANNHMPSEKAKGFCANRHHDATGTWPGAGNKHAAHADQEAPVADTSPEAITAAAIPLAPPAAWFSNPGLKQPTGLKVTADGRVYGHLATWGTCHIGQGHNGCVTAPKSKSGYAYFRTGEIVTAEGAEIAVGHITLDTTHASTAGALSAAGAQRHYEVTGHVVADVAAGEDAHGIWVAGALRPGVSPAKIREMRSAPLSGDWRRVGGHLELVAALSVNVPGFPIPRPKGLVAGGVVQSLVAGGMVPPARVVPPGQPGALSTDDLKYLKRLAARERREEASAQLAVTDAATALARRVRATSLAMRVHNSTTGA